MVLAKLFRPWRDSVPTAVELRSADFSPPPLGTCKSAGSGMNFALQVRRNWLNSTAVERGPPRPHHVWISRHCRDGERQARRKAGAPGASRSAHALLTDPPLAGADELNQ